MVDNTTPAVGRLLSGTEGRDAIHFALAPVRAQCRLVAGEHVGVRFDDGVYWARPDWDNVGIVDPFLREPVPAGEWCWLFLYPGTITDLRHVWRHRAFQGGKKALGDL